MAENGMDTQNDNFDEDEWYEQEYARRKAQLRARKCPYCGEPIKAYIFSSALLPFEIIAKHAVFICGKMFFPYSVYFNSLNTPLNFCRVVLTSTCACGNISTWNCDRFSIMALLDKEMGDEGYYFEQIYHKETLKLMLERSDNKAFNLNLEKLLGMFTNESK